MMCVCVVVSALYVYTCRDILSLETACAHYVCANLCSSHREGHSRLLVNSSQKYRPLHRDDQGTQSDGCDHVQYQSKKRT